MKRIAIALTIATTTTAGAAGATGYDFGATREQQLRAHSEPLFGVVNPVAASSTGPAAATGSASSTT